MVTNILKRHLFENNDLWYPERVFYEDGSNGAALFLVAENV